LTAIATEQQLLLDEYLGCTAATPCPHMDSLHVNDFALEIVVFFVGVVLATVLMAWRESRKAKRNTYKEYLMSLRNLRKDPTSAGGAHE